MDDIQRELRHTMYGIRLLIFLESEPQSNKYNQVLLSPEQFKEVSLKLGMVVNQEGNDQTVSLETSEELYTLPDLREHA